MLQVPKDEKTFGTFLYSIDIFLFHCYNELVFRNGSSGTMVSKQ